MATIDKRVGKRGFSYKFTWSGGYALDGTQMRQYMSWKPDPGMSEKRADKEAERLAVLFDEKCSKGLYIDSNVKFADFAERWFKDYADKQLRPKTVSRYHDLMKRINPAIGHIKVGRVQPHHLLAFYDNLEEPGIREDMKCSPVIDFKKYLKDRGTTKISLAQQSGVSIAVLNSITSGRNITLKSAEAIGEALCEPFDKMFSVVNKDACLSPKTIRHHHALISSIMETAVEWQVITDNPCNRIQAPKAGKPDPRYLDEVQAAHLLELLEGQNRQYQNIIRLLLFTGLRRGEVCGLEWDDIDFENHIVNVCRSSLYIPEKGVFQDVTKNDSSTRSIKVTDTVLDILQDQRRWQAEQQLRVGDKWRNSSRIFVSMMGGNIHPDSVTSWFHRFISQTDLPQISIHSLRHTNVTLQINCGVPVTTIAARLGHSSVNTTNQIYIHAIRSANEAAAEALDNILNPKYRATGKEA